MYEQLSLTKLGTRLSKTHAEVIGKRKAASKGSKKYHEDGKKARQWLRSNRKTKETAPPRKD